MRSIVVVMVAFVIFDDVVRCMVLYRTGLLRFYCVLLRWVPSFERDCESGSDGIVNILV